MSRRPRLFATICTVLLAILWTPSAFSAQTDESVAGHWEGAIVLPSGELRVTVDLEHSAEGWTGTIDIPVQGAKDFPLAPIEVDGKRVRFSIRDVPGDPTFIGTLADGEISGSFTQGGGRLSFRLGREIIPPPARPQTPQPPFPYDDHEVTYPSGSIELAGTLSVPHGDGPFPAVVLLTGSGPQNRDEEILGHKPFQVLADHLARRGIAVLRSDDRGVGGSGGSVVDSTTSDFADDALAGVSFLAGRTEIRGNAIGLLGHSEGGLVAPLAASRSARVAFLVLLAAPSVPGSEILPLQTERIALANGTPAGLVRRQVETLRTGLSHFRPDVSEPELRAAVLSMVRAQIEAGGGDLEQASDQDIEKMLEAQVEQMVSPWFRFFISYDPVPALEKVRCPVLALNGELDLQVDVDQNLEGIGRALERGGNEDVTLRRMPGLNHLFQTAKTGAPSEYHSIEETMSPAVLETVASWIRARF